MKKNVILYLLALCVGFSMGLYRRAEVKGYYKYSQVGEWVVSEGDTLWRIANSYSSAEHQTAKVIDIIKGLNEEDLSFIYDGQEILVPLFDCIWGLEGQGE